MAFERRNLFYRTVEKKVTPLAQILSTRAVALFSTRCLILFFAICLARRFWSLWER